MSRKLMAPASALLGQAFCTTPLDVIRMCSGFRALCSVLYAAASEEILHVMLPPFTGTRHVLWPLKIGERRSLIKTISILARHEGLAGFWRGVVPRTIYMGLGGMVYLGTYSYCSTVLTQMLN